MIVNPAPKPARQETLADESNPAPVIPGEDSRRLSIRKCRGPVPRDNEVLVQADTIGVSMPEVMVRRGTYAWMPPLPAIPGIEMSGTIVECGDRVADRDIGDRVFVSARDPPARAGCYAEYIAVPSAPAHVLLPGCDLEAAACLSHYHVA